MKDKFTVIECNTPVGDILITDVSYDYTKKIATHYENMTYEPPVIEAIRELEFTHFLDVGAAYGFFSLLAASKPEVKKVFAYEPHPIRYGLLWWNTHANPKITPRMEFVGDDITMAKIAISNNPSGLFGGEAGKRIPLSEEEHVIMPTTTLDNTYKFWRLATKEPMHIMTKIDVEGFEANVLKGAQHLFQPGNFFIVETHINAGVTDESIIGYMTNQGFGKYKKLIETKKNSVFLFRAS
jgi:FkbM family methyltransferase